VTADGTPSSSKTASSAPAVVSLVVGLCLSSVAGAWPPASVAASIPSSTMQADAESTDSADPADAWVHPKIAVLPMVNLSGVHVPMREVGESLRIHLQLNGIDTVRSLLLEQFLEEHRVRFTGGLTTEIAQRLREETGATAALVSSVDLYSESYPPKIAVTARLVATDETASILWMDGVALSGDSAPGIFDLGLVRDPWKLRETALVDLSAGLGQFVYPHRKGPRGNLGSLLSERMHRGRHYRPKTIHRVPVTPAEYERPLRVAVIPFANDSTRRNADQIMMLHFVTHLVDVPGIEVIEPGVVREVLLRSRLIMEDGGISFPQAEILRALLDVDLVFAGTVLRYLDFGERTGSPEVDFSMRAIDTRTREVVWTSISYNRGDERVYFFDSGRVYTAHAIASAMAREALSRMLWEPRKNLR
jgi:hypothetical protein